MSRGDTEHKVRTLLALARSSLAGCKNPYLVPGLKRRVDELERRLEMVKGAKNT